MKKSSKGIVAAVVVGASFATGMFADTLVSTIQAELHKDLTIIVDGEKQTFQDANGAIVYPIMYNGTTYLPVRAIGGLMGKNVGWDGATRTITLKAPTYDLGGSLVYEDSTVELRFKRAYKTTIPYMECDECVVEFTVNNKSDKTIDLLMDTFGMNGVSYTGLSGSESIAPNSTGLVSFSKYVNDETSTSVFSTFSGKGIETVSGRFSYYLDDNWLDSTDFSFANVSVK